MEQSSPRRRLGRPPNTVHGTFAGRHLDTGEVLSWSDGVFAGHRPFVVEANTLCDAGTPVDLTPDGPQLAADRDDPLAVMAVMSVVLDYRTEFHGDVPWDRLSEALLSRFTDEAKEAARV